MSAPVAFSLCCLVAMRTSWRVRFPALVGGVAMIVATLPVPPLVLLLSAAASLIAAPLGVLAAPATDPMRLQRGVGNVLTAALILLHGSTGRPGPVGPHDHLLGIGPIILAGVVAYVCYSIAATVRSTRPSRNESRAFRVMRTGEAGAMTLALTLMAVH